ncbi:hypothetical protein, variant [Aphanomyces invadans]|uniref:Calponin-homology (CH) domain-containing protein n=1 Tax=Aphanomyces invadans TaxID=157072 RepID=A0A024TPZ5_9STRA|nr:hypothetical protein, variant [Aphanomyces invadans]ETV96103.1 hypothetical protein, variant [Aphanomyces invadans]|eukprot:XP_008875414.1 hypothetical protein, variant [Aphanomyces invadans]
MDSGSSEADALVYSPTPVNSLKRKAPSSIASEEDKENLDDSGLFNYSPHSPVTSSSSNGSGSNLLKRKAHTILDEIPMPVHKPGQDLSIQTAAFSPSPNSSTSRYPNNQLDSPRKPPGFTSSISTGGSTTPSKAQLNHTFLLNNFQHVPSLDFGMLSVGSSLTMELHLSNPSEFGVATVVLEDIVPKAAAAVFFVDTHQTIVLPMQSATTITVTFTPSSHGRVAGKLYIRLNKRFRLFCALHGATRPASTASNVSSSSSAQNAPQSSMVKRPKLAKQPSIPQTSSDQEWKKRRMVFDANWISKQEAGFQKWLNFTLLGAHFSEIKDETPLSQDRYAQLRQLAVTRLESKIRAAAVATFHNPQTDHVLFRLQSEINTRRLMIRSDRPLHVDVGLQQTLMDLFNSYHPLWLTLALEVVLGIRLVESLSDLLRPSTNAPKLPHFLKRTILERIVQDPAFKLKHVMAASATSSELLAQLQATTLVRCLMIVYFLDQAHVRRHVDHVALPCLFRPSSRIKRSKQVLIEMCQQFLAQEGNVLRHLDQLEYRVEYQQTVLEEMDMQVVNLAVDLRDGVRLARLLETLDPSCKGLLSPHLRLPAVSRLQKVHNVQVTLTCLQAKYHMPIASGVESSGVTRLTTSVSAKDIVDGHREKTLALLWQLISYFKLSHVVHVEQVEMEILRIQQRRRRGGVWLNDVITTDRSSAVDDGTNHFAIDKTREPIAWHLLEWCRVVCANYNVPIRNYTASFADGKALCLMVHYYHPRLLEKWEIQWTTSDTTTERMATMTPLLANERANFALVNHKVKQLGQVPVLLPLFDSEHLPEEKCILTFLAYLHARLLGASREIHAAFCLQHWWVPRFRRSRAVKRDQSVRVLQRFWASTSLTRYIQRSIRRRLGYICTLQSFGRVVLAKQVKAARLHAVYVLQTAARRWLRPSPARLTHGHPPVSHASHTLLPPPEAIAATTLQAWWHRYYHRHQTQTLWRALVFHGHRVRHTAATVIQRWYHRHHVQGFWYALVYYVRLDIRQTKAATTIQTWVRRCHDATRPLWRAWGAALEHPRVMATLRLQTWWRHCRAVRHVQQNWNNMIYQLVQRKAAVRTVLLWWRHVRTIEVLRSVVYAAVDVHRQDLWNQVRMASAMRLQRWYRNYSRVYAVKTWWTQLATVVSEQHADAATTIQRAWLHHHIAKKTIANAAARKHAAVTVLQSWARRSLQLWRCRETWIQLAYDLWELDTQVTAARMIQAMWRRRQRIQRWRAVVNVVVEHVRVRAAAASRLQQWWTTTKHLVNLKQWWVEITMALWERRDRDVVAATILQRWFRACRQVKLARQVKDQLKQDEQVRQKQLEEDARMLEEVAATRIQLWWVQAQHVWDVKQRWKALTIELWQQRCHELATRSIQCWWRQVRAVKVHALMDQIQMHASVRLQRWWRRHCHVHRLADFWHHVVSLVRQEQQRTAAATLQTWAYTVLMNQRHVRIQHRWAALVQQVRAANAAAAAMLERLNLQQQREKERRLHAEDVRSRELATRRRVAATTLQLFVRRYQQLQWWRSVVIHVQNQHAAALYIQQWWHAQKFTAAQRLQQLERVVEANAAVVPAAGRRPIAVRTVWTIPPVVVLQKWWRGIWIAFMNSLDDKLHVMSG